MPADLKLLPASLHDKGQAQQNHAPSPHQLQTALRSTFEQLLQSATQSDQATFMAYEASLVQKVRELGKLLLMLFLCVREQRSRAQTPQTVRLQDHSYALRPAQPRNLSTMFGPIRYWRSYLRGKGGRGLHPLDVELGLTTDRLSMNLLSLCSRLATMLSYAKVHATLGWFLGSAPSTEVIEQTVLGLGRRTAQWFEQTPAPPDDGEVLIIQIDSKGAPTATQTELQRRRGKRRQNPHPESARHRGRARRALYGNKPRRKKGDKSKNARLATMVVMYTLRRAPDGTKLLGPLNKRSYASFAPKRHAFAVARREADKRGFTKDCGKLIQILTDGDEDLATYAKEYFPEAIHTIDVVHVLEYIYQAGECLYKEGSAELRAWVNAQKELLYSGKEALFVARCKRHYNALPATGPGNKGRRERLWSALRYVEKRLHQMNYKELLDLDLELGTGMVEGGVKNLIGARFDFGGSRWIRERAEALLQLRCIELNGQWESFIAWLHDDHRHRGRHHGERIRIQHATPGPLPTLGLAA